MDINKMLAELRAEREAIEEAILTIERLALGQGKRRGRPPAWLTARRAREQPDGSVTEHKGKRVVSPEARARMAAAQRRRWAVARKAQAQSA